MKKASVFFLAAVMMIALLFTGCATPATEEQTNTSETPSVSVSATPSESSSSEPAKKFKIGFDNFDTVTDFGKTIDIATEEEASKLGLEVIMAHSADVVERTANIENFVQQGCDAIILGTGDINQVEPAIKEAKAKGIIIGSMDAGATDLADVYVASDNPSMGKEAAEYMLKLINNKGNIIEIYNDAGMMIVERKEAMHEAVAQYPEVKIAYGFVYAWPDYMQDTKSKMEALLTAHPNPGDISAVFATFDGVGVAAAQAIREKGLQDSIVIVGIDGDAEAYQEMKKPDSPFKATMAQDPDSIARTTIQKVSDLLNGKTLDQKVIKIPAVLTTVDNIPAGK